jgi:hypothetical protein
MFGFNIPQAVIDKRGQPRSYWGARAIFQPQLKNPIDLLPDRQTWNPTPANKHPLLRPWLDNEALPWLRQQIKEKGIGSGSSEVLIYHRTKHENYTLMASPQRSYGYLYIGAWRYDPVGDDPGKLLGSYELLEPTEGKKWSAGFPIPKIGDRVIATVNSLGLGTVLDYFWESDFQGIRLELDTATEPEWHKKQCPNDPTAMIFGAEARLP